MEKFKDGFILHPEYNNFVPGQTPIAFKTLSPRLYAPLGCISWIVGTFIVLPLFLFTIVSVINDRLIQEKFSRDGRTVSAVITSCAPESSPNNAWLVYTYRVDEADFTGRHKVKGLCSSYAVGQEMDIVYMASTPSISQVVRRQAPSSEDLIVAFVFGIGLCLLAYRNTRVILDFFYAWGNRSRLQTKGVLLDGEIMRVWDYHASYMRMTLKRSSFRHVIIDYRFRTPRKKILTGYAQAAWENSYSKDDLPSVGTRVTVLYVDDNTHVML